MIRKYLIVGRQLYLQSKLVASYNEIGRVIELYLPIKAYWNIKKQIQRANYLVSTGESKIATITHYRKIFHLCARYAAQEKERNWLYDQSKGKEKE